MDLFNSLPDNVKRELLRQNNAFLQSQMSQFNQEMLKAVANANAKQSKPAQQQQQASASQLPQQQLSSLPDIPNITEQLIKNSMKQPIKAPTPPVVSKSKPKSNLAVQYKALKEELTQDREAIRRLNRKNEIFRAREDSKEFTDEQLMSIAEYCEIDVSELRKSHEVAPMPLMWWKSFESSDASTEHHRLPFKSVDENLCKTSSLYRVIQYLLQKNPGPIKGQSKDFQRKFNELDPRLNETFLDIFDPSQPLMLSTTITDDHIKQQEERVNGAKRKLDVFLANSTN